MSHRVLNTSLRSQLKEDSIATFEHGGKRDLSNLHTHANRCEGSHVNPNVRTYEYLVRKLLAIIFERPNVKFLNFPEKILSNTYKRQLPNYRS